MKVTIESTAQIIEVTVPAGAPRTAGRLWVGTTEKGVPVQLLVLRVAVPNAERQDDFKHELEETPAPTPEVVAFPLRMVL